MKPKEFLALNTKEKNKWIVENIFKICIHEPSAPNWHTKTIYKIVCNKCNKELACGNGQPEKIEINTPNYYTPAGFFDLMEKFNNWNLRKTPDDIYYIEIYFTPLVWHYAAAKHPMDAAICAIIKKRN